MPIGYDVKQTETLLLKDLVKTKQGPVPRFTIEDGRLKETVTVSRGHYLSGITPTLEIYSWDVSENSPSGMRHIPSGHFAFESVVNELGYLDFGLNASSGNLSNTRCLTFKVKKNIGPFGVTGMRLWVSSHSGLGNYHEHFSVNMQATPTWTKNKVLASGVGQVLPTALPVNQNVKRNDGSAYMDGGSNEVYRYPEKDINTSQYCYLSLNTKPSFYANKVWGFGGTGALNLRMTFDYFADGYHW